MSLINGAIGDQVGQANAVRQGYSGEMSVGDRHGRYMEATLRKGVFTVNFAAAALAVASATAAGAFVLLNPAGSGVLLALLNVSSVMTANTPVATGTAIVLGALVNPIFSALGTAVVPQSNLVGSTAAAPTGIAGYPSGTYAVLPSVTPPGVRIVGGYYADLAASALPAWQSDPVDGAVIIQPGNGVNLYGLGGTPADITVAASMTFESVPLAS